MRSFFVWRKIMAIDIGPRIGIKGEQKYRDEINKIITQAKTLSSEMRMVESSFNDETTAQEKAAAKAKILSEQIKVQNDRVQKLSEMLQKSKDKYGENGEKTLEWQQAVNNATTDLNKMQSELNKAEKEADGYGEEVAEASSGQEKFNANAQMMARQKLEEFWNKASESAKKFANAAMSAAKELDEGYDTIITKTGATGEELEALQGVANKVYGSMAVEMADVGEVVGQLATRFDVTGDELEDLSKDFLQFSSITGVDVSNSVDSVDRIMKIFKVDAEDTTNVLGLLTSASQETGIGVDKLMSTLDTNGAAFQELGFDISSATALLASFEENGVDASGAMTALKKAIQNASKQGKDANDVLAEAEEGIKNAATETEALQIASDTFGSKGAIVMAQGIRDGRIELTKASESIEKYGDVVSTTYEATLDPWDETQKAMNRLKTVGSELAGQALSTLVPAIEKVADIIGTVQEWFEKLSPTGQKVVGIVTALGAGAAVLAPKVMSVVQAFSAMKTASAVTKSLGTATEGATTAQKAFNLAVLANPIVAITAGVLAAVGAITALTYALADASDESIAFADSSKAIASAASENASSVQSLADESAATVAQMQAQEEIAGDLIDTIETLSKKENKSADEVDELRDAVRKLNSVYPELNLQYDEAADNLNMTNRELEDNIRLTQEQAKATAYAKLYNELIEKQTQLEIDLKAIENQRNASLEEHAEIVDKVTNRGALMNLFHMDEAKTVKTLNDGYKALDDSYDETTRASESTAAQIEVLKAEMEALGYEVDPVTGYYEELAEASDETVEALDGTAKALEETEHEINPYIQAWNGLSASQKENAEKVAQAYRDMESAVANSIESQMNMFEEFEQAESMSTETMLANMQSQINGVTNWESNLVTLSDRGINKGLLQYLMEMGPKGASYVQTFVNMSDTELAKANKLWEQSVNIKGFTNDIGQDLKKGMGEIVNEMNGTGYNLGAAMAGGMTDAKAAVIAAARDMARSAKTTVQNELQIASPSKVFKYLGEMTGEGFQIGLDETMPQVFSPFNNVSMVSGRSAVNNIDPDAIYSAVRSGAENAQTKIVIGTKEFGRLLRGMGVVLA